MGQILRYAMAQEDLFDKGHGAFFTLPDKMSLAVSDALISPGKVAVNQSVAGMTGDQVRALINKIDRIYRSDVSTPISDMVAEGIRSAIDLVRIISQAAGSSTEFAGILASGQQLDVWAVRPKDIGGVYLNGAGTAGLGLYGGVSAQVKSWLQTVVAGISSSLIPLQTTSGQSPFGGLVIFGGIEKTYTPKIESIQLTLQGQAGAVPPQPVTSTMKRTFGDDSDISVFWLEKPVIITNNESFGVNLMPNVSGTTNFELVALMVGQVQSKVF